MHLSHKIKLNPNNVQATYFQKAAGVSRLAYNWGLEQWSAQYNAGGNPSAFGLKKQFNNIKKENFPFVYEVTKTACERAFTDLDSAFKRFFGNYGSDVVFIVEEMIEEEKMAFNATKSKLCK